MIASGMTNIVLLVVGAAWLAVLIPPLLRSRVENRPGSSIVDFRRQLASLQRTVPTRGVTPVRQMARPLAPSPGNRSHGAMRQHTSHHAVQTVSLEGVRSPAAARHDLHRTARHAGHHGGHHAGHHTQSMHRAPLTAADRRRLVQQRRQNVLFALAGTTAGTAALAFATASALLTYAFVLSAVSLAGYCYKLVQLKNANAPLRPVAPSYRRL